MLEALPESINLALVLAALTQACENVRVTRRLRATFAHSLEGLRHDAIRIRKQVLRALDEAARFEESLSKWQPQRSELYRGLIQQVESDLVLGVESPFIASPPAGRPPTPQWMRHAYEELSAAGLNQDDQHDLLRTIGVLPVTTPEPVGP
jgi:hypothetical protein